MTAYRTGQPIEVHVYGRWHEGWYREASANLPGAHHVLYRSEVADVHGRYIWTAVVSQPCCIRERGR